MKNGISIHLAVQMKNPCLVVHKPLCEEVGTKKRAHRRTERQARQKWLLKSVVVLFIVSMTVHSVATVMIDLLLKYKNLYCNTPL